MSYREDPEWGRKRDELRAVEPGPDMTSDQAFRERLRLIRDLYDIEEERN